jgi:hypothetical protein
LPTRLVIDGNADDAALARFGEQPVDAAAMQAQPARRLLLRIGRHMIEPRQSGQQLIVARMIEHQGGSGLFGHHEALKMLRPEDKLAQMSA